MTNNRLHKRTTVSLKISLQEDGDDISINFSVVDISEGGLFVKSNILWEPGQIFFLNFVLPGSDDEISVKGEVARSEDKYFLFFTEDQTDPIPGMGLKFVDLSDDDRERIKAFIEQN
jgi:type IV pilus assembly protein PilZ